MNHELSTNNKHALKSPNVHRFTMKNFDKFTQNTPSEEPAKPPRLNKYVANAGICSRRKADEHIKNGLVQVNDEVVIQMGYRVQPGDVVKFEGKIIEPEKNKVYILMNKPKNVVTTVSDEKARKTVMEIVKNACTERIYPVGRLDRNTTGLLLLTNDGSLADKLMHPRNGVRKIYHVTLDKALTRKHLQAIYDGITLEDGDVMVDKISYLNEDDKTLISIEIHIGRNRIVRRIFEHFKYVVKKLDRVYYGGLTKKKITRGHWRHLTEKEVIMLKHFS